jgi:hypothetical protein
MPKNKSGHAGDGGHDECPGARALAFSPFSSTLKVLFSLAGMNFCAMYQAKFVDHPSPISMELSYITSRFNIVYGQIFGVESISGIYKFVGTC